MFKAKILVVGSCKSGKSVVANFLADATETHSEYHPTQAVRILEFEVPNLPISDNRTVNTEIEMWDCSGDRKFEACWPMIAKDTNGILFVFDPDAKNYDKDLEMFHDYFVREQGIKSSHCIVFANHHTSGGDDDVPRLPSGFDNVTWFHAYIDDDGENVREEFNSYLSTVFSDISDKREQEELSIMNKKR